MKYYQISLKELITIDMGQLKKTHLKDFKMKIYSVNFDKVVPIKEEEEDSTICMTFSQFFRIFLELMLAIIREEGIKMQAIM